MTSLEGQFIEATRATPRATESEPAAEMDQGAQTARVLDAKQQAAANPALGAMSVLHLQRAAGNASVAQLLGEDQESPVKSVVGRGGGEPLDDSTRGRMESALGADFSDVRVHSDGAAAESAKAVSAHAYTVGNEVVFSPGRYDPSTPTGERTLAHELTHVVQQRSGPVDGSPAPGGIRLSDPSDRFEQAAERSADSVLARQAAPAAAAPSAGAVQRQEDEAEVQSLAIQREGEEEEEVQGLAIQREGEEEEEVQGLAIQREGEEEEPEEAAG